MLPLFLVAAAMTAEPTDAQRVLLQTFRDEFISLVPGDGENEKIPAEFTMGDDSGDESQRPAHRVKLAAPFQIARYEVPQNLWEAVMGRNPSKWKGPRNSVEMLSFDDAQAFCRKATKLMRTAELIGPKQAIRLPSEAEWEYAARAGTTTRYSFGDDARLLVDFGWFHGNAAGNDPPVGAKKPNAWKLYDVHGYLWEWCADAWHDDYSGAPADGSAWTAGDGKRRVLRGGSWKDDAERLTSAYRRAEDASFKDDAVGLRCVLAEER